MKIWGPAAAVAAMLTAAAPASAATMIGDTVTCTASAFGCSAGKATIGTGAEFSDKLSLTKPYLSFDFSADTLKISNLSGADYGIVGKFKYSFQDMSHAFTDATLLSSSGFIGIGQANFSVADGVLTFASPAFSATKGAEMTLRITTAAAVPEAATWATMMLGIGAIGIGLRRRRAPGATAAA